MNGVTIIRVVIVVFCSCLVWFLEAGHRKVLLIGMDGVRSDALIRANTPYLDRMFREGYGTYESWHQDITKSGPSWSSILCGVYSPKHGVIDNTFNGKQYHKFPMIPQLAKWEDPELKFGMYMEWNKLEEHSRDCGWDQVLSGRIGRTGKTAIEACEWIQHTDLDFYFVYFGAADCIGHSLGFSPYNPFYRMAIEGMDRSTGKLLEALKKRIHYDEEDWLILVTTDHGGRLLDHGGYSEAERKVFWIAYNDRIQSCQSNGADHGNLNIGSKPYCVANRRHTPVQTDITVTALHHLLFDRCVDPAECESWSLDGRSWLEDMGLCNDKIPATPLACL